MRIAQQLSRIFRYGRHALLWLSLVGIPSIVFAQSDLSPSPMLLERERALIENSEIVNEDILVREKEQMILTDPIEMAFQATDTGKIAAQPSIPPIHNYNAFVYLPQRKFAVNPLTAEKITLPPLPVELFPMGVIVKKKTPSSTTKSTLKSLSPTNTEMAKKEAEKAKQKNGQEMIAMSPFLSWVKENKEKASETAKENAKKYQKEAPPKNEEENKDLFLSIRFPYKGNDTTGNSVAIYSTPEK